METKEKLGALVKWNDELHIYELADENKEALENFIIANTSREVMSLNTQEGVMEVKYEPIEKIESEADNKLVWKLRKNLNAKKKEIDTKRKQAVAIMVNDFIDNCKSYTTPLDEASKKLTALINEYKASKVGEEAQAEKKYTITIKTTNAELVKQIEDLAYQNGATWDTKEA